MARLERGAVRWPGRDYRAAFAAVLGAAEHELGFRPPRRSDDAAPAAGAVPEHYPDDGLLALAARAEVTEVGAAVVEAAEEVAELLARAYATTLPALLLTEVRRRAFEVAALLDRRSTLAQRRRLLVVGGVAGAARRDRARRPRGPGERGERACGGGIAGPRDRAHRVVRVGGGDRVLDGTDRPAVGAGGAAGRRRGGAGPGAQRGGGAA
ncbi:MAG: hypothetical protein ACRDRK_05085, partial [Pseudonocardia sp.]